MWFSNKGSGKVRTPFNITVCFFPVWLSSGGHYITNQPKQCTSCTGNPSKFTIHASIKFDAPPKVGDKFMTSHHIIPPKLPWALDPPEPSRSVRPVRPLQLPLLPDHLGICGEKGRDFHDHKKTSKKQVWV